MQNETSPTSGAEPLQARIRELEIQVTNRNCDNAALRAEVDRWKRAMFVAFFICASVLLTRAR